MRMRKKKNLLPRMEACSSCLVRDPFTMRGQWRTLMPDAKELRVELGCGKAAFESVCSFDVLTPQISTFPCMPVSSGFWGTPHGFARIYRQYFPAFPFDTENFRAESELFRGFCPDGVDDNFSRMST